MCQNSLENSVSVAEPTPDKSLSTPYAPERIGFARNLYQPQIAPKGLVGEGAA